MCSRVVRVMRLLTVMTASVVDGDGDEASTVPSQKCRGSNQFEQFSLLAELHPANEHQEDHQVHVLDAHGRFVACPVRSS